MARITTAPKTTVKLSEILPKGASLRNGNVVAAKALAKPKASRKSHAKPKPPVMTHPPAMLLPAPVKPAPYVPTTPTGRAYHGLDKAYDFFNLHLFGSKLPPCVITLQRHKGSFGYFAGSRFRDVVADASGSDGKPDCVDEIALNPATFRDRSTRDVLSTLIHEMTHLEQHHFGKPSKGGYHNAEWADLMDKVGLCPSHTGEPGGKRCGLKMKHYIVEGGPFDRACVRFFHEGGAVTLYADEWTEEKAKVAKVKRASKTKFTCPDCGQNAWAKPDASLMCGDCERALDPENPDDEGDD